MSTSLFRGAQRTAVDHNNNMKSYPENGVDPTGDLFVLVKGG